MKLVNFSVSPCFKAALYLSLKSLSFHICGLLLLRLPVQAEFSGRVHPSGGPSDRLEDGIKGLGEGWCRRPRKKGKGGRVCLKKKAMGGA